MSSQQNGSYGNQADETNGSPNGQGPQPGEAGSGSVVYRMPHPYQPGQSGASENQSQATSAPQQPQGQSGNGQNGSNGHT